MDVGISCPPFQSGPSHEFARVGRHVALRPITSRDYDRIYRAEMSQNLGSLWRHRGVTPPPERFAQSLWDTVFVQYGVVSTGQPELLLGLVAAYKPDFRNGLCFLAVASLETVWPAGIRALEGVVMLVDYIFQEFPMRKIYAETYEFNIQNFATGAGRWFSIEGRLREYEYAFGRYWDKFILSTERARWEAAVAPVREFIYGTEKGGVTPHAAQSKSVKQ